MDLLQSVASFETDEHRFLHPQADRLPSLRPATPPFAPRRLRFHQPTPHIPVNLPTSTTRLLFGFLVGLREGLRKNVRDQVERGVVVDVPADLTLGRRQAAHAAGGHLIQIWLAI